LNYFTWVGDQGACITILDEITRIKESYSEPPVHLISDKVIKANYYAWLGDESELALKLVEEGLSMADKTGIHVLDSFLAVQGGLAALNKGDDGETAKYMRRLKATLRPGDCYVGFYYYLVSFLSLHMGKHAEALAFAMKMLEKFQESGMPFPEAWARMLISWSAHEINEVSLAEKELDACNRFFRQAGSSYFEFTTSLIKAFLFFDRGKDGPGLETLGKAMKLGRQNGYTNTTLCIHEILSFLCAKALGAGIEIEYVREFVRKRRLAPPLPAAEYEVWPWPVKIYILGRFELFIDGKRLEFSSKAPRRVISLLKLLLARGESGAGEEQLADILWPDSDGDAAHQSFSICLHRLRQLLGNEKMLPLRDGVLKIDPKLCWVDAHAFEELITLAERETAQNRCRLLENALNLYQGPFLTGSDEPWALSCRERLRNRFLRAVQRLGEYFECKGLFDSATDLYRKGIETDVLAEEMYRRLMKCHHAAGRKGEAIAAYERCREVLRSVLGIEPSSETEAVYRAIDK
jgi:DNA-binding SARP family transcriptional activator